VGSSFKPYVYTAAIESGMKPYDHVLDEPTTFFTAGGPYTPHNYEADYRGSMTLIDAFAESRNIPALRLADKVGIKRVIEVARRFGITSDLPAFLPVAIGAADITLTEQVGAYSVFPNDGIRIAPHTIRRVTQADGIPLQQQRPQVSEVISVDTARAMMTLLEAVVQHGTAGAAAQMNHALGGKTGTTNNYTDAWFIGFSPSVTCGTWMGYDTRQSLGEKETGARAALPIWIDFMKAAVADKPDEQFARPDAPKRTVDVPVSADDQALPVKPPARTQPPADDSDVAPVKPAPAPVPVPLPAPQLQVMPNDVGDTSKASQTLKEQPADDQPTKRPSKVKKLFGIFHKGKKKDSTNDPPQY
jgi:penicillin-binding protein 1A